MRILVTSDTHGDFDSLQRAIKAQPTAKVVLHLGDGDQDIEQINELYPGLDVISVRGNCDSDGSLPLRRIIELEEKRIFMTHGHIYNVKLELYSICSAAQEQKADIVIFGHTHSPLSTYHNGMYILNPGSLHGAHATYGTLDITPQGVVTNIINLNG